VHTKTEIQKILYRALAKVELELPAPASGAFIPTGNAFDALKAIQRIFGLAKSSVLIVDPYLNEKILTDYAIFIPETVSVKLLADASSVKPTLGAALRHWRQQYGAARPIIVKVAPPRSLHDRSGDSKLEWVH
jgi:hypothetical protein